MFRTGPGPSELSHSSPNLTANLESNGVYISKTPAKYPTQRGGSETDDDGGFKKAIAEPRPPLEAEHDETIHHVSFIVEGDLLKCNLF